MLLEPGRSWIECCQSRTVGFIPTNHASIDKRLDVELTIRFLHPGLADQRQITEHLDLIRMLESTLVDPVQRIGSGWLVKPDRLIDDAAPDGRESIGNTPHRHHPGRTEVGRVHPANPSLIAFVDLLDQQLDIVLRGFLKSEISWDFRVTLSGIILPIYEICGLLIDDLGNRVGLAIHKNFMVTIRESWGRLVQLTVFREDSLEEGSSLQVGRLLGNTHSRKGAERHEQGIGTDFYDSHSYKILSNPFYH